MLFALILDLLAAGGRLATGAPHSHHAVVDPLRMALHQRGVGADCEVIHHSGRGGQYSSIGYTETPAEHDVFRQRRVDEGSLRHRLGRELVESFKTGLITDRVWRAPQPTRARDWRIPRWLNPADPLVPRRAAGGVRGTSRPSA